MHYSHRHFFGVSFRFFLSIYLLIHLFFCISLSVLPFQIHHSHLFRVYFSYTKGTNLTLIDLQKLRVANRNCYLKQGIHRSHTITDYPCASCQSEVVDYRKGAICAHQEVIIVVKVVVVVAIIVVCRYYRCWYNCYCDYNSCLLLQLLLQLLLWF